MDIQGFQLVAFGSYKSCLRSLLHKLRSCHWSIRIAAEASKDADRDR